MACLYNIYNKDYDDNENGTFGLLPEIYLDQIRASNLGEHTLIKNILESNLYPPILKRFQELPNSFFTGGFCARLRGHKETFDDLDLFIYDREFNSNSISKTDKHAFKIFPFKNWQCIPESNCIHSLTPTERCNPSHVKIKKIDQQPYECAACLIKVVTETVNDVYANHCKAQHPNYHRLQVIFTSEPTTKHFPHPITQYKIIYNKLLKQYLLHQDVRGFRPAEEYYARISMKKNKRWIEKAFLQYGSQKINNVEAYLFPSLRNLCLYKLKLIK